MKLTLTVYSDEFLTKEVKKVEADRLKIPYRVAMYVGKALEIQNVDTNEDIYNLVMGSIDYLDMIIRATFGLTEEELACIDSVELIDAGTEIYKWFIEKINKFKGKNSKNAVATA